MRIAVLSALLALVTACTSGLKQPEFAARPSPGRGPHRTVVLFVVDGLAVGTLRTGLRSARVPNLNRFFLHGTSRFAVGEASFPTLTYPNLTSILTARGVGEHPVLSNHVLAQNGRVVSFEDAKNFPLLRSLVDPASAIGEMNNAGKETASFSYVLGQNATDHMRVGVQEGLEYQRHHYQSLDARLLDNLARFLRDRGDAANWPDFMYVHLVGVDGFSHRYGPNSRQTRDYLAWLDQRMGETLALLERGEKRGNVVTVLTADHGFVPTYRHVSVSKIIRRADLDAVILNEGRFLAVHLPPQYDARELAPTLRAAREERGVELTVLRHDNVLELAKRGGQTYRFAIGARVCEESPVSLALLPGELDTVPASSFRCPTDFDDIRSDYPFLVGSVSRYLTAPGHPDALVIAEPTASFANGMAGSHGGPTAAESFVPVLLRNARLEGTAPVRTRDLLKILLPKAGI